MRKPPEPSLPPTATLKPPPALRPISLSAGVSARSCDSAWVQTSLHAVMVTLNLRGRLVNDFVADEHLGELAHHRRGIEQFVGRETGHRATDHAADIIHAGLQRDQIDGAQAAPKFPARR